jgi:fatty acid desaturase
MKHSFAFRIAILLALSAIGLLLALCDGVSAVVGIIILGGMFTHAMELQHQCLHNTGFKSQQANRIVGTLLGLPTLTSFQDYRRNHLRHHRFLGTAADTPFFIIDSSDRRHYHLFCMTFSGSRT